MTLPQQRAPLTRPSIAASFIGTSSSQRHLYALAMKRDLALAGKAVGGAGLTGAVLYLVATAPTHVHVYWPYWLFLVAVLVGVGLYLAGQERNSTVDQKDAPPPTDRQVGPAVTDRWQPTINKVSSGMLQLQNNSISHPGYSRRSPMDNPPPSVRIGVMVACSLLDPAASTSDLRARFLSFLDQPPVMDLVRELTEIGEGAVWTARDDNPPFNFGAVLAPPHTEEAPVAWARILLPDSLTQQYGRDARCAFLVLYVEPRTGAGTPAQAASLVSWHQRLTGALKLPAALTAFRDDLGLCTANDPAAEMGVWLKAPHALTELVEVDAFDTVAGSPQSNWFMGFAIAGPDGEDLSETALTWLRQMCDSSLHLDDYESALASLRPQSKSGPRLIVRVLREEWDTWHTVAYTVALEVEVANTTDSRIRIASVGLGSDWNGQPPGELPVFGTAEQAALDTEVAALRKHRYAPELRSHQYVPPQGSVTGWIVSSMARPPQGGTPRLTLSVREAVGSQYLLLFPRKDPQIHSSPAGG
jgi:hypothetical protein